MRKAETVSLNERFSFGLRAKRFPAGADAFRFSSRWIARSSSETSGFAADLASSTAALLPRDLTPVTLLRLRWETARETPSSESDSSCTNSSGASDRVLRFFVTGSSLLPLSTFSPVCSIVAESSVDLPSSSECLRFVNLGPARVPLGVEPAGGTEAVTDKALSSVS